MFARSLTTLFLSFLGSPVLAGDAALCIRAGLDAEALSAAGVTSNEVAGIVADLEASDAFVDGDLATADAAYGAARKSVDELRRLVRSGQATPAQVQELADAKADLAQAETDRQTALDALFDAGAADLSAAEKATLSQIRANRSHKVAVELLAVSRTDAEWIALKKALKHEKVCTDRGEALHSDVATLLANARAVTEVSTAKSNLDTNLAAVTSAWNTAVD